MNETERTELVSLVSSCKEHLTYLNELGVELVTARAPAVPPVETIPKRPATSTEKQFPTKAAPVRETTKSSKGSVTALFQDLGVEPETLGPSAETFAEIHAEIGACTRCPLHQGRTNVVHTEGSQRARLMFVGEAPGADEDFQARPFVGRAGQLLTKIIEAIGFKREEVLIGNINRCRPPGNRAPTTEEAGVCKPYLLREIAVVQPDVIVVLGNTAMHNLLNTKEGITRLRGRFQDYKGIKVMPTYHPAFLLRDPSKKRETWEDLKQVRDYLEQKKSGQ
jgi:DNA polymerase